MKKLKNTFLLGFLISFSIFLGVTISFLVRCYYDNFTYEYMMSDIPNSGMNIERNYFKTKYFNYVVLNNLLSQLKFAVLDENKYDSNYKLDEAYYYDEGEEVNITEREFAQKVKKRSQDNLKSISDLNYFVVNKSTGQTLTNTNYKTLNEFKKNAEGYYQAQFENADMVYRKIVNTNYQVSDNFDYYIDRGSINIEDDIEVYISASQKMLDKSLFSYEYSIYNDIIKKYNKCIEVGIPALVTSVVFFIIYVIMNFKLPKTKREFWNYYNKIPLEAIVTFLTIDITLIFVMAEEPVMLVNQLCVIPIFILLFYFILLIKQFSNFDRKRDFLNTSWSFRILKWIFKKAKYFIKNTRKDIKTMLKESKNLDLIRKIIILAVACVVIEFIILLKVANSYYMTLFDLIFIFGIQLGFLIYIVKKLSYLSTIMKGIRRIKDGELNYKIEEKDDIYFGALANDINNISEGLENSIEQRIKSERMKSELITNVSHDLKTPLTSIINYVELIKKEENLSPEYLKDYVKVLDNKSKRLKVLIEDLFEASKASTGNIELDLVKLDLKQLLQQSIGELEDKLEESNLSLRINLTEGDAHVLADGRRMYRVFENLLSNISKYSLENTRVYVDMVKEDGKIITTMKNISSYELNFDPEEIMERFKRADESRNTEGSGLGLAIARDLVTLQGGNMSIEIDGDLFKVKVIMNEYDGAISLQK